MLKSSHIIVRIEPELKQKIQSYAQKHGLTLTEIITSHLESLTADVPAKPRRPLLTRRK